MAVCNMCDQEMHTADGCVKLIVRTVDAELDPIPYGSEHCDEPPAPGQRHHGVLIGDPRAATIAWLFPVTTTITVAIGRSPHCHDQAISCDCSLRDEEEQGGS